MNQDKWKDYAFEFASVFFAVVAAFALTNWNDGRKDSLAESKILHEIANGLHKDQEDLRVNLNGHKEGIEACQFWRKLVVGENAQTTSLQRSYSMLTRDFTSIQNTSGYETLKSRGFELVENDALRAQIISLYEFDYQNLRKLEEEYFELQFQQNYFAQINQIISPYLQFDQQGKISGIQPPLSLSEKEQKLMLSLLMKIQSNREFVLKFYQGVIQNTEQLEQQILGQLSEK